MVSVPQPQPDTPPFPANQRFPVKKIEVFGNTVLKEEIAQKIQEWENREVTFEDVVNLRSAITQLYIDNGYITSGAFLLNNQPLDSGVVQIQVVEGVLENIEISGLTIKPKRRCIRNRFFG